MNIFPQKLSDEILKQYGFKHILSSDKVDGGRMGSNFWFETSSGKYFLREYRITKPERIQEIHDSKKYFGERGVPVILPITTKSDSTYFVFEGKIYSVFPFVYGTSIERSKLEHKHLSKMGELLAKMHLIGKAIPNFMKEKERIWDSQVFVKKAKEIINSIESKSSHDDFDNFAIKKLQYQIGLVGENKMPYSSPYPLHLFHNDFHNDNLFFDDNGDITHVFDWEKVQLGTRAKEVVRALDLNVFEYGYTDEAFEKARVFLESYNELYPLSKEEFLEGIGKRYMNIIHSKWVEEEHYEKGNFRVDPILIHEYDRIVYYTDHLDEYVDRLFA